jgi:regulator of protease activity HflC (stomatin/prohibitin superfamily)
MTADKVSLRMNALVTYRIADARKAVSSTDDVRQALYRETQLALRAIVGVRELDVFLSDKDVVAQEIEQAVRRRASELGLSVVSVGIRDVILPGDMKDLMNKVTEAKKAAEANLIFRREETAAMQNQAGHRPLGWSGQAAGRQPDVDATSRTGSLGKDRIDRKPERRAWRKRIGRARGQLVVTPQPLVRAIGPGAFSFCSSERLSFISARPHDILAPASRKMNRLKN